MPEPTLHDLAVAILRTPGAKVRCCDCLFRDKIKPNRNRLGASSKDKYCPVPANGATLLNGMRSDQALTAWRRCASFEWDGEREG